MGHTSGTQDYITRIVIHCTVSPCRRGGARGNASYFQSSSAGGLAHYVVDPGEIIQCADETVVCWHAPPNHGSVGIELTDPQGGPDSRWQDADHQEMLHRAAELVVDISSRWDNVPLEHVNSQNLLGGAHGIPGHVDVSYAWHQSDHSDPGVGFPWSDFMGMVTKHAKPAGATGFTPAEIRYLNFLKTNQENEMRLVSNLKGNTGTDREWSVLFVSDPTRGTISRRHLGGGEFAALVASGLPAVDLTPAQYETFPLVK